ncbi:MAG: hypothetical protein N2Z68_01390 [Patescibacteria group bacterium]|nr:hypothetical protein [Patescibacteria group bacterium]
MIEKKLTILFIISEAVLIILVGALLTFAFTGPSQSPYNGSPYFWQMSGGNSYYSAGNIGIGTSTPSYKVHVSGGDVYTSGYARGGTQVCIGSDCKSDWFGDAPSGSVAFFNLSACPSGWSELTSARGRYIVSLPAGGTLAATVGTALSNQENRPVGQHTHTISDPGHGHGTYFYYQTTMGYGCCGNPTHSFTPNYTDVSYTGISVNATGTVVGTNAPYIQLLVCQKN